MVITKLNRNQYVKLKNLSYQVYIFDSVRASNKGRKMMQLELEKYNNPGSEEAKQISYNTLLFPFDTELYNFLLHRKLSDAVFQEASNQFNISIDVIKQKVDEYIKYDFIHCTQEGLIDYTSISNLPEKVSLEISKEEKNNKVS